MLEHNIRQLNTEPSRGSNTLDLVLESPSLYNAKVHQLSSFADHMGQIVQVKLTANPLKSGGMGKIDFKQLRCFFVL